MRAGPSVGRQILLDFDLTLGQRRRVVESLDPLGAIGLDDHQFGRIMTALSNKGLVENTVVLFTSDHGDFMGQHRAVRKAMFLYDALLHVPMIWHVPGMGGRARRTEALAQGIDIFPTLVELTGGKTDDYLPGRSLKPILTGENRANASRGLEWLGANQDSRSGAA